MSLARLLGRIYGLPNRAARIGVTRDLPIPMTDGARLLADRHYPIDAPHAPLVLIRTPYGRRQTGLLARLLAHHGYQVLVVAVRGTDGSAGEFTGLTLRAEDGPAIVEWLRQQPWFDGSLATWGASFLGYAQWELAGTPIPEWRAAIIQDAPSEVHDTFLYRGGAFTFADWVGWVQRMQTIIRTRGAARVLRMAVDEYRRRQATGALPATDADLVATGERIGYFREWLRHPEPGPFWASTDHRGNAANLPPHVHLAGGWQDIFLPGTLADDGRLRAAGRTVRLLVGPWAHGWGALTRTYLRDAFAVLDHALRDGPEPRQAPVRVYVTGERRWRDLDAWPPEGYRQRPWYLHASGVLSTAAPEPSAPSRYRYDPADPTPSVGGPVLGTRVATVDNRGLEARPDVLTFTSPALSGDVEVIGAVTAEIRLRSSLVHTDVFARLCEVTPNGKSTNVCDGIVRLDATSEPDPDGARAATVRLWPTAHRFRRGNRIRLQVSSGAHPRYLRNLGTGDQLGTDLLPADQEILHDPGHPSAVYLPMRD